MSKNKKKEDETLEEVLTQPQEAPEEEIPEPTAEEKLAQELSEQKEKYLRLMAEFDNYKKRTQKEKMQLFTDVKAQNVLMLLPALDNLERALAFKDQDEQKLADGLQMVLKQMQEIFEKLGVTEIEAQGKEFDPELHNAVMHIEEEGTPPNTIVEVLQKGYRLEDKVIRYAMVKVAN